MDYDDGDCRATVTSDGSVSAPYCTYTGFGCAWTVATKAECADVLCVTAGYETGTFVSADVNMCTSSSTDSPAWQYDYVADEFRWITTAGWLESEITAECTGSGDGSDVDGDGYLSSEECDDGDASINPGATEVCGNAVDEDCDDETDDEDECGSSIAGGDCGFAGLSTYDCDGDCVSFGGYFIGDGVCNSYFDCWVLDYDDGDCE
jgi:hypothetical protein